MSVMSRVHGGRLAGLEHREALLPRTEGRSALAAVDLRPLGLLRHRVRQMNQVSCQGLAVMVSDMFHRYAVRATMTAITVELKECAQGWCSHWQGVMR